MAKTRSNSAVALKLVPREPLVENPIRVGCADEAELNPKIAAFLAAEQPATPCLVVDLDTVAHGYHMLRWHLPMARVF